MDKNANIKVTVSTDGTIKKATGEASGLRKELEGAQKAAAGVGRTPRPVAAARAAKNLDAGGELGRESGIARSIGAGTGAAGRDFAKQSEGLGGLVRVYATFAANIFAATAAFGALSRAADTTNLVKGLDQLGAAGGRNLGSLAKQLVAVSDGAISLKDALAATAQASSGGMSNSNILKMGEVAKKAAQALGRDMPDALNRLTRGITKLEPELLDEIGIMVRLDDATRDYAKSIGKSALALTDFERRQAFANAVLEQGEKKFGNIALAANPYSKILASSQNLLQSGLGVVNTVLTPLLNILSSSPTALALAIGAIATTLTRQAIPAISGWRKGLDAAARVAREAAIEANKLRKTAFSDEGVEVAGRRDTATKNASEALERLKKSRKTFADAAKFDMNAVTEADIANLKRVAAEQAKVDAAKKDLSESTIAKHAREQAMAAQAISSLETRAREEAKLNKIIEEEEKKKDNSIKGRIKSALTLDAATQRLADKAIAKSQRADIINAAVNDAAAKPYLKTLGDMYSAIGKATQGQDSLGKSFDAGHKRMSIFNAGLTAVKGTVLVTAGAISTLAASLGNVFAMIGIFVTIYQVLDSFLSNSAKEAAAFSGAISTLDSSLENVSRTIDFINKKDTVDIISIESTQARATALQELTEATKTAASSFSYLIASWETWDRISDSFWDFLGKGSADKLSTSLAGTIVKAFQAVEKGPAREAGIKAIESITKVKGVTNLKALNNQLRELSDSEAAMAAMEIGRALDEMSKAAGRNAANLTAFQANLKETSDLSKTMIASLRATDNESKLGSSLVDSAYALNTALESPIEGFKALKVLARDIGSLSLIPSERAEDLAKFSKELDNISVGLVESEKAAETARTTIEEYTRILATIGWNKRTNEAKDSARQKLPGAEQDLKRANAEISKYTEKMNAAVTRFKEIGNDIFKNGIDRMSKGLQTAMAEATISFNKTVSSIIKSVGGNTAESDTQLRAQELSIQKSLIEATYAQSKNAMLLTLTLEQTNLLMERATQENALKTATNETSISYALSAIAKIDKTLKDVGEKRSILNRSDKDAMRIAGDVNNPLYEAAKGLKGYFAELFGKNGKLAQIMSQEAANALQGRVNVIKEQTGDASKSYDTMTASTTATKSNIEAQQALVGVFSEQLELRKQAAEEELRSIDFARKQLKNAEDYRIAIEVLNTLKGRGDKDRQVIDARDAAERASIAMKQTAAQFERETANAAISNMDRLLKGQADLAKLESERNTKKLQDIFSLATIELDAQQAEVTHRQAMGIIDEKDAVLEVANIARAKEAVDYANKLLGLESAKMALKLLERKLDQAFRAGAPLEELMDEYIAGADALQRQLDIINAGHKAKLVSIENTKKQGIEEAKVSKELKDQKTVLDGLNDAVKSMAAVFGEVGDSIGGVVTAIGKMTVALTESGNKEKAIQDQLAKDRLKYEPNENDDGKDRIEKAKQLAKVEQKATNDTTQTKLDGYLAVASTAKSLFKEQSRGAQAMAKIEKAIHIAKLAMWVKEQVAAVTTSGTTIAASLAAAGANSIKAITAAFAAPFPVGFVAGAAMIAIMSSLLGGKSKSVATPGFSAEEQQKVQGTGQSYVDGQLVNRGGGALGDPTAKASSIQNSIERLEEHSFSTMEYSNKMLDNLKDINKNTEVLGAVLLQEGFNTKGTNPDGSSQFGTTAARNPVGLVSGLFGEESGWAKLDSKVSNFLWGGKTKTELQDIGITINGLIGEITSSSTNLIATYENIKTSTDGGLFRSDKVNTSTTFGKLDNKIAEEAIQEAFRNIASTVEEAAVALGKDKTLTSNLVDGFNIVFKTSFKDLNPEELTDALNSEFSVQFNLLAERVLPEFQKFRKPAEEFGDTIVRLARDVQVTGFALEAGGLAITNIADHIRTSTTTIGVISNVATKVLDDLGIELGQGFQNLIQNITTTTTESLAEATVRITERLIDVSGGLDAFVEKANFFTENFLTEAERLAPIQSRLSTELDRLGYAGLNTRESFALAVKGLDLATDSGQDTYAGLMKVAEAFAEVYPETRKVIDEEERLNKLRQQQLEILKLEGKATAAIVMVREDIIKDLGGDSELISNQNYIFQLEDEAKVRKLNIELMSSEGEVYKGLLANRTEELRALTDIEQVIKNQIYAAQDMRKTFDLETKVLSSMGYSYESLYRTREKELLTLSETDKELQHFINAQEDLAKTRGLEIELMEASGDAAGALYARRKLELRGLSASDQLLKIRIWRLKDEADILNKSNSQQIEIMNLLNNASGALALTRKLELETLDAQLRPAQEYIYALQDEATLKEELAEAYDKQKAVIESTIDSLTSGSKALKDYKQSLSLSDKSPLSPQQLYTEAKAEVGRLAAVASGEAVTDAQKSAKDDAISKLPGATDAWLDASKTLYASSQAYSDDYALANKILDSVSSALDTQVSEAEKQLSLLETSTGYLNRIDENTRNVAEITADLLIAITKSNEAKNSIPASTPGASSMGVTASIGSSGVLGADDTMLYGINGASGTIGEARSHFDALATTDPLRLYNEMVNAGVTSTMADAIRGMAGSGDTLEWALRQGFPAFANGGLATGRSIVGESGGELVDFQTPGRVYSASNTVAMMGNTTELVNEIKALRQEVAKLREEQKEQTGHLIQTNYDANTRAAEKVVSGTNEASNSAAWKAKTMPKVA